MVLDEKEINDIAEIFKVFGDYSRIKILLALYEAEESVSDLAEKVSMSTSAVSHQLRILKQSDLVKSRRDGKQIYYGLSDDHVKTIIAMGKEHIEEDK